MVRINTQGANQAKILKQSGVFLGIVILLLAIFGAGENAIAQQNKHGRIMGRVVALDSGEPLIGASVLVEGTKLGSMADLDGNYIINNVPVGTYWLTVSAIGHTKTIVENVVVTADEATKLEFSLKSEEVVGETVVVEASRVKDTEAALLNLRQQAPAAQDAISSEAMSRSGAGDAASAMTRITGASVVDGKTAVVRGLVGRYANTQLNGSQLPSTDPDKPAVQLDLIPAGLLDNITVVKTFTPDKHGNFTGGSVNLNTKDLPEKLTLKFSTSATYNSSVTWKDDVLTHAGGPKDWLGFDDDHRDPPQILVDSNFSNAGGYTNARTSNQAATAQYLNQAAHGLSRDFSFQNRKAPLNQSYSLAFGNLYSLAGRPLGVLASLSYNRSFSYSGDGFFRRYQPASVSEGLVNSLSVYQDFWQRSATEEVLWGALVSTNYKVHPNHQFRFTFNRNQNGEKSSRSLGGWWRYYFEPEDPIRIRSSSWQYTERSMQSLQYSGEHSIRLPLLDRVRVEWAAASSKNTQDDPDLRYWTDTVALDENGNPISASIASGYPYPAHYWRYLDEKNREYRADITIPLSGANTGSSLKFGVVRIDKTRDQKNYLARLIPGNNFQLIQGYQNPNDILIDENLGIIDSTWDASRNLWVYSWGIHGESLTDPLGTYTGEQDITAAYGMFDIRLSRKFDIIAGARFEETDQYVQSQGNFTSGRNRGEFGVSDWLPSVNLVAHAMSNMNIRGAFSVTTARPTIREMAPFGSFEFITSDILSGNPDLTRSLIRNWDLRWEWFTRPGEVVAVSGFYKHFTDPIERFYITGNNDISFRNVPNAKVYGLEIEFRRSLDHTGVSLLRHFQVGGNFTLVHSEVELDAAELAGRRAARLIDSTETTRPFGGQSPFVLNLDLLYTSPGGGTEIALYYNTFGQRLMEVGYSSPDIYEKSRQQLDFSISRKLFQVITAKLAVKNLLDEDRTYIQEIGGNEYVRSFARIGRSLTLGMTYSL